MFHPLVPLKGNYTCFKQSFANRMNVQNFKMRYFTQSLFSGGPLVDDIQHETGGQINNKLERNQFGQKLIFFT